MVSETRTSLMRPGRPPLTAKIRGEGIPHGAFGGGEIGRVHEGEVEAMLPFVTVPAEVPDRVARRVRQSWQLPADGLWHDDRLITVLSGSPDEVGGQRKLKRGQEDDLA